MISGVKILALQSESTKRAYENYKQIYEDSRGCIAHSETTVLKFLTEQSDSKAPTTLWTMFSLVKKYLLLECDVDLGSSSRIVDFLKSLSRHHLKKKAAAFTKDEFFRFIRDSPSCGRDLVAKIIALTGYYGALRCCELTALNWEDVTFVAEGVLIKIGKSKTDRAGVGTVKLLPKIGDDTSICPHFFYSQYFEQNPDKSGRLFRHFQNGKFIRSPFGKNTIASIPKEIAIFLRLPNPDLYTGHAFRVTSATSLADSGANTLALKRHGRWASESIAEGYVRESKQARIETANLLSESSISFVSAKTPEESKASMPNITFINCAFNGTVNFNSTTTET